MPWPSGLPPLLCACPDFSLLNIPSLSDSEFHCYRNAFLTFLFPSASLVFGVVTFVAGITGTVCGSELSKLLGHWTLKAEAYVCSISMLLATPFLYAAITTASESLYPAWVMLSLTHSFLFSYCGLQICVFMSVFCFCLNWAPVAAILLVGMAAGLLKCFQLLLPLQYSVVPTRRSSAEALQILISHLFGDAISPTVIGVVGTFFERLLVHCVSPDTSVGV